MNEPAAGSLRESALRHLRHLTTRGRTLREALTSGAAGPLASADVGIWQQDCAAAVNEHSGGSKAHWLSRAYSDALLVRGADGGAVVEANVTEIIDRVLAVLNQAAESLSRMETLEGAGAPTPPAAHRFDFVRNRDLRPILEQAFASSLAAFEAEDFTGSLVMSCSILEAILTDRLEHCQLRVSDCQFEERIAAAEHAGLIRRGCARLPASARAYRDPSTLATMTVTARDAKVARQVLQVVMRDLDPGR